MKKIIFILLLSLSGGLFAQSECVNPYPIILKPPFEPIQVPFVPSDSTEKYDVLGYTLKLEGHSPILVKGNVVMTKFVKEYLDKNCKGGCRVNLTELVVRRYSDGVVFTLGGELIIYSFWYPFNL